MRISRMWLYSKGNMTEGTKWVEIFWEQERKLDGDVFITALVTYNPVLKRFRVWLCINTTNSLSRYQQPQ
jgi:hypothetical protein